MVVRSMRLFKRKKPGEPEAPGIICPHCGGEATFPSVPHGGDAAISIKTWRGKSYLLRRCGDCGQTFYADIQTSAGDLVSQGENIDDEEELRLAEEELKQITDDEGDHRYPSH